MRTYFKTLKNHHQRVNRKKHIANTKQWRCQRMINVSNMAGITHVAILWLFFWKALQEVLKASTSLDNETKEKLEPLMRPEYMSSDETASSNSEDEESCPLVPHMANKTFIIRIGTQQKLNLDLAKCHFCARWQCIICLHFSPPVSPVFFYSNLAVFTYFWPVWN